MWGDTGTQGDGKMGGEDDWGFSDWQGGNDHPLELLGRVRLFLAVATLVGLVAAIWWAIL
jgi:hypothetical protein